MGILCRVRFEIQAFTHGLRSKEFVPQGLVGVEGPSHGEDDRSRTVAVLFGTSRFFRLFVKLRCHTVDSPCGQWLCLIKTFRAQENATTVALASSYRLLR